MTRFIREFFAFAAGTLLATGVAGADPKPAATAAPTAAAPGCKAFGGGKCCDPAVVAHLPKEAVFSSCGESTATYLGEKAGKDSCRYYFKAGGEKEEETYVEVYAPAQKLVQDAPNDPFFQWKKAGRAYYTERALSPKMAATLASSTGLWLPGKGYVVSVNATTKVCSKSEAKKLALKMK